MKQKHQTLNPISLATSASILTSTTILFTTVLASITNLKTLTPIFQTLYGPLGYNLTITGAILGTIYLAIDTFRLTYLFAWIYNKLL